MLPLACDKTTRRRLAHHCSDRRLYLQLGLKQDGGLTPIELCRSWEAKRLLKPKGRRGYGARAKKAKPPVPVRRTH